MENSIFTSEILNSVLTFVNEMTCKNDTAHGIWHSRRVWETALWLSQSMHVDLVVIQLSALLHDTYDWKYQDADKNRIIAKEYLAKLDITESQNEHIEDIIENLSYTKNRSNYTKSLEGQIVQDSDRLEAIGATGIIRTIIYSGSKGYTISEFQKKRAPNMDSNSGTTSKNAMNHFYEKLLLLKDSMNTEKAKAEAIIRHQFMLQFIDQFYSEISRTEDY